MCSYDKHEYLKSFINSFEYLFTFFPPVITQFNGKLHL